MGNYKLVLEYDGTDYKGFQKQPDLPTVQGILENALEKVVEAESPLYAAGRTDAGVHARGQVVNLTGSLKIPLQRLPRALNSFLPHDVVVRSAEEVEEEFNARRSAVSREYVYYIHKGESPPALFRRYVYHYRGDLDTDAVRDTLDAIIGSHDFASFCRREEIRSTQREIYEAELSSWGDILAIRIKANAFAWMMMRMLAGSLLEVGRGKWAPGYFVEVLEKADNSLSGPALPPHGLVLEKVYY
jgi:tRNA pseudouridine38-40 synthase